MPKELQSPATVVAPTLQRESDLRELRRLLAKYHGQPGAGFSLRVQARYDTDPSTPEQIDAYMHCAKCLDEVRHLPQSPREYARTQAGILPNGNIQIVCTRHECNVAVIDLRAVIAHHH